jgi:lysine/ornithine N-monooxygenase
MSVKEARMMFIGRFANLNMIHAKISRREYIKDYVEWTFENQEVVYKYVRCD